MLRVPHYAFWLGDILRGILLDQQLKVVGKEVKY